MPFITWSIPSSSMKEWAKENKMTLEAPKLDTRTFEEIYREARLRVPRYTPDWTDFNESDPGVALLQLSAWLTESMLYQMNRVPERNYIKFLQMLNLELRPAQPAMAHVTFTPRPKAKGTAVPQGTQISAQPPDGGDPLIFETEAGLSIIRPALTDLQVFDGAAFRDVSQANQMAAVGYRPFGWTPQVGSALYLGFATDPPVSPPIFPQQLRFRVFLPEGVQTGLAQNARQVQNPPIAPVRLFWEYKPSQNGRWRRLNEQEDSSTAFTREGYILLEGPREIEATQVGLQSELRYWLRCRIQAGSYPANQVPVIDFIRPNVVTAVNLATVRQEILGISEGHPGQTFTTRFRPVQANSLDLWVEVADEEPPLQKWEQRTDFLASGPDDYHYVLNATKGEVIFGGERLAGQRQHGRIPPAGATIIAQAYRHGGGKVGNVDKDLINTLLTPVVGIDSVTNERPAVAGQDEQPASQLINQAPQVIRSRNRAVTAEDFTALAQQAGGIARATAIPLAHPDHPLSVKVPGAITVVIVPDNGKMPPQPTSDETRAVCRYLEQYRLLTTELYVKGPNYTAVHVTARVESQPYASPDIVSQAVKTAINNYLNPLTWGFGQEFYPTSLYGIIQTVKDVAAVPILEILVNNKPYDQPQLPVVLGLDTLIYGTPDHEIVVVPNRDLQP
jgi:predicted phage baseplate assembly protein